MKKYVSLVLAIVLCAALFAGCANNAGSSDESQTPSSETTGAEQTRQTQTPSKKPTATETLPTESAPSTEPSAEPSTSSTTGEQDDAIDMEAFLTAIVANDPNAGAEEICRSILESPYFVLFDLQSMSFYWPGVNFGFEPEGVKDAWCVTAVSSNAVVACVDPDGSTDLEVMVQKIAENLSAPDSENDPDATFVKAVGGKVFYARYYSDMRPITEYAAAARDFVGMFHSYLSGHPDASCAEIAEYFVSRQKLAPMIIDSVTEGRLRGFGHFDEDSEIHGFADGTRFEPTMEPNTFICYVFTLKADTDAEQFVSTLRDKADLAWNICVSANTIITETDGSFVLFMMCSERKD